MNLLASRDTNPPRNAAPSSLASAQQLAAAAALTAGKQQLAFVAKILNLAIFNPETSLKISCFSPKTFY